MKPAKKSPTTHGWAAMGCRHMNMLELHRGVHAVWITGAFIVLFRMGLSPLQRAARREDALIGHTTARGVQDTDNCTFGVRADWRSEYQMPTFCERIAQNPQPFRKDCKRDSRHMNCSNLNGEYLMYSQFGQDYYVYSRHFSKLKREGIYLDVATNDPVSISNTFFMDRCLQWKGVCVEANPAYFEKIHRLRSCHIVPTCVGRKDGEVVEVGLQGGAGGILGKTFKHTDKWAREHVRVPTLVERCTTVQQVLDRGNVGTVDYLSLDVEGHELEVLKGVDWSRTRINVMTIEVTHKSLGEVEGFLEEMGYRKHVPDLDERSRRTGMLGEDIVFLHADVEFGSPM